MDYDRANDEFIEARLVKLARLEATGVEAFPRRFDRTHRVADCLDGFDRLAETGEEVRLAGRIMQLRTMGKLSFAQIEDVTGKIQLFIRSNVLGDEAYARIKELDIGDIVGARGPMMRTKTGEISVEVRELVLLAKSLRPLPGTWYGLSDTEKRYRQRYLDLIVNEEVRQLFLLRSKVIGSVRRFLDERGFVEVETPALQPIYGGAAARPFVTHHNALDRQLFLRIATELYLKRLIVGGLEKVYEIGKNFRNEGISTKHNPEFTVLETYEAYADYNDVMAMTEALVSTAAQDALGTTQVTFRGHEIELTPPWRRATLRDAIRDESGVDYTAHPDTTELRAAAITAGARLPEQATRGKIIDELLSQFVEPKLIQPTFLVDYPIELSPFAKKKPGAEGVVERFEAFAGGMEFGNAFTELNDPRDQYERFLALQRDRAAGDEEAQELDDDFLTAMEHGMPPTGGLGIGIDRIVMLIGNAPSIREVILFPQLRALSTES